MTLDPGALDAFFDEAVGAYRRAAQGGEVVRHFSLANRPLRVRYATRALADDLGPAMQHLARAASPDGADPFTVYAWGGELPHGQLPLPPWEGVPFFERGNVRGHHGQRFVLAYDRRQGTFSAVDHERQVGLYWARESAHLSYYERAEPFRRVLPGWRQPDGLFVVHASAVGYPQGGVMLAGRTGSGKSTSAVLCLGSALGYAGDDRMLVQPGAVPHVHSIYSSAKVNRDVLDWRPDLRQGVANADRLATEKALLYAGCTWPHQVSAGFPLRAILLPHTTSNTATVARPVSSDVAYKTLLPDTLFTVLGPAREVTRWLSDLVRAVPCYDLALGTDVAGVPAEIESLLHDHRPLS